MAQPIPEPHDTDDVAEHTRHTTGRAIRAARKSQGLSQKELADQLGVRRESVVGWEQGRHAPHHQVWDRLEQALHLRVDPTVPGGFRLVPTPPRRPRQDPHSDGDVNIYIVVTSPEEAAAVARRFGANP